VNHSSEQDEYAAEGIQWEHIDYFNNKIVCDLIEAKRPAGIIAYLDEESIYPNGSDASLLQKMNRNLSKHPHYMNLVTSTNKDVSEFGVKHYAGTVLYSTTGMLEKNKDLLFRDLITLAGSSKSSFIQDLFPESKAKHDMKRPVTAGWQVRTPTPSVRPLSSTACCVLCMHSCTHFGFLHASPQRPPCPYSCFHFLKVCRSVPPLVERRYSLGITDDCLSVCLCA
jgi:myosin heavy subunit